MHMLQPTKKVKVGQTLIFRLIKVTFLQLNWRHNTHQNNIHYNGTECNKKKYNSWHKLGNCNIHALLKISIMNETKWYENLSETKRLSSKYFSNLTANFQV